MGGEGRYRLIEEALFDEKGEVQGSILVLGNEGRPTFLEKMMHTKRDRHDALLIRIAAIRLRHTSKQTALDTCLIKSLSDRSGIYAFELRPKPRSSTIRVMIYLPDENTSHAVLLFAFKGHRGDKNGIPQEVLDKAKHLAQIAKSLCQPN